MTDPNFLDRTRVTGHLANATRYMEDADRRTGVASNTAVVSAINGVNEALQALVLASLAAQDMTRQYIELTH